MAAFDLWMEASEISEINTFHGKLSTIETLEKGVKYVQC